MRSLLTTATIFWLLNAMTAQEKSVQIQFLGMNDGCPNTPKMWKSLNDALHELEWTIQIDSLDVFNLAEKQDPRAGFGAPTVLVNGKDLFGTLPDSNLAPSCRFYPGGLPSTRQIVARLKELTK